MKGNPKLIETLNTLLADELTAISQYMVHSGMSENWGYGKLHDHFEKRAIDEMKHAEKLIGRVLFLEGIPMVSKLLDMHIGAEVSKQLENDHSAEEGAIKKYNAAIVVAGEVADFATREMLAVPRQLLFPLFAAHVCHSSPETDAGRGRPACRVAFG